MVYHTLRLIMNLLKAMTLSNFSDNFPSSFKLSNFGQNFPTSAKLSNLKKTFQLRSVLSNFALFFPTSVGFFQLRSVLSNFSATFQLQTFQLKTFQLLVLSNCPFQLHVSPWNSNGNFQTCMPKCADSAEFYFQEKRTKSYDAIKRFSI